jgi:hypothetical protein
VVTRWRSDPPPGGAWPPPSPLGRGKGICFLLPWGEGGRGTRSDEGSRHANVCQKNKHLRSCIADLRSCGLRFFLRLTSPKPRACVLEILGFCQRRTADLKSGGPRYEATAFRPRRGNYFFDRLETVLDTGSNIGYYGCECGRPAGAWRLSDSPTTRGQNTDEESWLRRAECGPAWLQRGSTWCLGGDGCSCTGGEEETTRAQRHQEGRFQLPARLSNHEPAPGKMPKPRLFARRGMTAWRAGR